MWERDKDHIVWVWALANEEPLEVVKACINYYG